MLLIDCHEPSEIIKKLETRIPVKVLKLKYGDYSFSDVIIERKTLSDFFTSLKNQRLNEQMENLSRFYAERYLIIEGFFDFSYVNNIDYLYSELFKIALNFDVKILFSKDCEKTASMLKNLYFRKNFGYKPAAIKRDKIHHAAMLFGISRNKMELILSKLGSLGNIANSSKKELTKIKSVGKKTMEQIRNTLNNNI